MAKTSIEWATDVWNPSTGCTKVSAGCDNCYAERMAARLMLMGQPKYANGFAYSEHPDTLSIPFGWKTSRTIFVNSMSDLFHHDATFEFVREVFHVMCVADWHTYLVLTKRPDKARVWIASILDQMGPEPLTRLPTHIWIGTSVEDARVISRIPQLLKVPARVRFLSCEPLIGPIDLSPFIFANFAEDDPRFYLPDGRGVDWVIAGAESGPGARPMDEDWVRGIRDACFAWDVPFFYKQNTSASGKKMPTPALDGVVWTQMPAVGAERMVVA